MQYAMQRLIWITTFCAFMLVVRGMPTAAKSTASAADVSNCLQLPLGGISGVLRDIASNLPVKGGNVQVWSYRTNGFQFAGVANTDDTGAFSIGAIKPGVYRLLISKYQAYAGQWHPGKSAYDEGADITVSAGVTTTGVAAGVRNGFNVSGRITYDNPDFQSLQGSGGIDVSLVDLRGMDLAVARTDATGLFTLNQAVPGRYRIIARPSRNAIEYEGYVSGYYPGVSEPAQAKIIDVGGTVSSIDFQLTKGGTILGLSVTADTGKPIAMGGFYALAATNVQGHSFNFSGAQTLNSGEGSYIIHARPGTYRLRAGTLSYTLEDGRMYAGEAFNDKVTWLFDDFQTDVITVTKGGAITADFRFDPAAVITGAISGITDALPLQPYFASLQSFVYVDANTRFPISINPQGNGYKSAPIRAGTYKLKFEAKDYAGAWYGAGATSYETAQSITLGPHQTLRDINISMTPCSEVIFKRIWLPSTARN